MVVSGDTAAVYDARDNRVSMLSSHTGELMSSVRLSQLHSGPIHGRALTAAGTQRFLLSV